MLVFWLGFVGAGVGNGEFTLKLNFSSAFNNFYELIIEIEMHSPQFEIIIKLELTNWQLLCNLKLLTRKSVNSRLNYIFIVKVKNALMQLRTTTTTPVTHRFRLVERFVAEM